MKNAFVHILKHKLAIFGLVMAVFYQFLFIICWQTGFGSIPNNVSNLKVAIVNEDPHIGSTITNALVKELPYKTKVEHSMYKARDELSDRKVHMIVKIPKDFTKDVTNLSKKAQLDYYVNESNPMLVASTMESTASNVASAIDKKFVQTTLDKVLSRLNVPDNQAAKIVKQASQRVIPDIHKIHHDTNMGHVMAPFMLGLAGYIAAMILQLNLFNASRMIGGVASKWQKFAARNIINLITAFVCSFIAVCLVELFNVPVNKGFFVMWGFQFVAMLAFMAVTQIFVILFGLYGLLVNLTILILQTQIAGGSIPIAALPDFYYYLGKIMPMKYTVNGTFDILLGGPSIINDVFALVLFVVIGFIICVFFTSTIVKEEETEKPIQYADNEEEVEEVMPSFHHEEHVHHEHKEVPANQYVSATSQRNLMKNKETDTMPIRKPNIHEIPHDLTKKSKKTAEKQESILNKDQKDTSDDSYRSALRKEWTDLNKDITEPSKTPLKGKKSHDDKGIREALRELGKNKG
ncbi:YhgE/Pip domain-containing protein [Scopulibacillus cellulosilyticus]|uniref:YhgE/Pip domain-containing protein n=1 Tax=Scopulibacillus cellulosilyticus TaxID=2665665 RepID=A0ABW2PYT5_9BACL